MGVTLRLKKLWARVLSYPPEPVDHDTTQDKPEQAPLEKPLRYPDGHFYSPIVDVEEVTQRQERIWPSDPVVVGIDFNDASHQRILTEIFPRFIGGYDYPELLEESESLASYFTQNSQFGWLDSRALFVLLQEWKPRKLIEVGSGFSSLLVADTNRRFLNNACEVTCVEPFPRAFLKNGLPGVSRLLQSKVQEVPLEEFARLDAGDILFIDSSHVSKTGSDVNFLFFEVLPRLKSGVIVHVHDIFLPHDYLKDWVLHEARSWNEQYILRAMLTRSSAFEVLFGCTYANHRFPQLVKSALRLPSGQGFGGGSFWFCVK